MAYGSEVEKLERRWMENPMGVSFAPLAEAYRRAGDQARALEVLAIGLANHPAYVPALIVQARCHLDVRADGAAEQSFLAVLGTDGHNLIALKGLADICERSDRPEQARTHLVRLLEADPTHEDGQTQLDRVVAVLAERERVRGQGAGATGIADTQAPEVEAEIPEPVEPAGFEPTATGSPDEPAGLEAIALSVDAITDPTEDFALEEPGAGSLLEGAEPELAGSNAEEAEPLAGLEAVEPAFEVEKETGPFEVFASDDAEPWVAADANEDVSLTVPFEEELPSAWLEQAPAEWVDEAPPASADETGDEPVMEATAEPAEELPAETSPPEVTEAVHDLSAAVWAPMGSAWAPEATPEPGEPETPLPVAETPVAETPWDQPAEPEAAAEPGPTVEVPEPVADAAPDAAAVTPDVAPVPWAAPAAEERDPISAWAAPEEVAEEVAEEALAEPAFADELSVSEGADELALPAAEAAPDGAVEDDAVVVVEGAESEEPSDPEPEIEPALVMTQTMARLFEKQGHRTMALAIYAQLAEQEPDNPDLAAAVERLTGELAAEPSGRGTAGTPRRANDPAAVGAILGRGTPGPSASRGTGSEQADRGLRLDAPATRASDDLFSLSAVFGTSRPAAQSAVFTPGVEAGDREPSFDEFFGSEGTTGHGGGPGGTAGEAELEQFTAWLRSLKR